MIRKYTVKCRLTISLLAFAAINVAAARLGGFQISSAALQTRQTSLELRADDDSPTLVSVGNGTANVWRNHISEKLIEFVIIAGRITQVHWKLNRQDSHADNQRVAFVYESASPKLRLVWEWKAPASTGPVEHTIHIQNLESREIWIPMQDSFGFDFSIPPAIPLEHFYVEKGAGAPSLEGTHLTSLPVTYHWNGTSSTYAHPAKGEAREVIPFFAVETSDHSQSGVYVGIEFSGRTRLTLDRDSKGLRGVVGLNPDPGPFRSRLKPHETFDTPTVFVGAFDAGVDALGNVLRPWVRQVLGNPSTWRNPDYPVLVNNSWGSGMQVDEALAAHMIRDSAELGLEMFHLDAGWFRGVGDWYPDPKKFPHGLAAMAEDAHQHGLKFGIWADWTQAGLNALDPKMHDWLVSDLPPNWKPDPFKGQTIDIGDPDAGAYAKREVFRMIKDYRLDMLEHDGYLVAQGCVRTDHPHAPPDPSHMSVVKEDGNYFVESSNSTDVSYHAVRAYYDIYADLRRRHPNVLLEICNDGGRMVDFGSAAHGDYFSITDSYDPLSNRRAFYDASHLLPAAMLESYVEKWPTPKVENFRYMLRSGMLGWLTIMQDTNAWSEAQHAAAKEEIQLYKTELRQLIRDANLYHIAPRPDGIHWDGIEYFDPRRSRGVVYVFRGSTESEQQHNFKLAGLDPRKQYQLKFHDHSAVDQLATGADLLAHGLTVELGLPNSSELVFIQSSSGGL